jgi:hypothetical protein
MEFQWAFSCQVPSRNTAGNAFSSRKLRMALKHPETACPGTENVGDFDGRPGHGCRYRHMTRTLHQPITCAKAKTAATAAPAASFLPTIRPKPANPGRNSLETRIRLLASTDDHAQTDRRTLAHLPLLFHVNLPHSPSSRRLVQSVCDTSPNVVSSECAPRLARCRRSTRNVLVESAKGVYFAPSAISRRLARGVTLGF